MKITDYKDIGALPVGTVAKVASKYSASDWVKTSGSTWASLGHAYTQEQVDDFVARRVNNVSPANDGEHSILNPEAVIAALIKDIQDARRAVDRQRQSGDRATYRLQQIEEFINGDHECTP